VVSQRLAQRRGELCGLLGIVFLQILNRLDGHEKLVGQPFGCHGQVFVTQSLRECHQFVSPPPGEGYLQLGIVHLIQREGETGLFGEQLDRIQRFPRERIL